MRKSILGGVLLAVVMHTACLGSGMLIPKDASIPPLAIKHQRVDIRIKDGVATARIEQVFKNSTNRDLEAVYVFPLPENAGIGDFAMYINGKRMSGELVEKGKARRIYQDIVRRMKDPGLLEYIGGNLFRVSVYPVPKLGEQKIELEYSQTLEFESGLYKYVYPLRTGKKASRTLEDFTVSVRLLSSLPIRNVYSPSHKVGISQKGDNEAVVGFEEERSLLDRDFVLYYGVSKKDFGLNLLTHAVNGRDGFFMMMLSPTVVPREKMIINKDVTFVFDTSGSMVGKKIRQAREALKYCVSKLNKGDRFNVVRFSTDVEPFEKSLVEASEKNTKAALRFVSRIEARGGTNINGALAAALRMEYDKNRPNIIVFLTDGKPTIGESDTENIVANVNRQNNGSVRIFVFGVGEGVNAHLLDKISGGNGGLSQYVKQNEDIEVKVSSFSDKISKPVLGHPEISVDKLKLKQIHPRSLPDLFCGDQITVFGRYEGQGHVAIRLTGEVNGKKREFVYEGTFQKNNAGNEFIPRLWATRRVGYLLDEIRLHGEGDELKDEVILLSREYGIMTPYTSYLVLENEQAYSTSGISRVRQEVKREARLRWARGPERARSADKFEAGDSEAPAAMVPVFEDAGSLSIPKKLAGKSRISRAGEKEVTKYFEKESGADAIRLSEAIRRYKGRDTAREDSPAVRHVGKKIFYLINGVWVDSEYKEEMKSIKIKFAGDEYFKMLSDRPELKRYFALGEKVIVCLDKQTAVIVE